MRYCRHFINGISAINFTGPTAKEIRRNILQFIYQELFKAHAELNAAINALPEQIEQNPEADEQLQQYRENKKRSMAQAKCQLDEIAAIEPSVSSGGYSAFADEAGFIQKFAENFRNIKHLASILSDAPLPIKKLQSQLYIHVLLQLTNAEKEAQLRSLSDAELRDMIQHATKMHDGSVANLALMQRCKDLVQGAYFELLSRGCAVIQKADKHSYKAYLNAINGMRSMFPDVESSDVLDDFSHYQSTDNKTLSSQLAAIDNQFGIDCSADWANQDKINALKARKALLNHLRFGQGTRRDYAKQIQLNLVRDLFWARNIHDIRVFTESNAADEKLKRKFEQKALEKATGILVTTQTKADTAKTVQEVLNVIMPKVRKAIEEQDEPAKIAEKQAIGKLASSLSAQIVYKKDLETRITSLQRQLAKMKKTDDQTPIRTILRNLQSEYRKQGTVEGLAKYLTEAVTPTIEIMSDGKMQISIYDFSTLNHATGPNSFSAVLAKYALDKVTPVTIVSRCLSVPEVRRSLKFRSFTVRSLDDFKAQVNAMSPSDSWRNSAVNALTQLEKVTDNCPKAISDVPRDNKSEILLRKLLELKEVYSIGAVSKALSEGHVEVKELECLFAYLDEGNYDAVLSTPKIQTIVGKAYACLATIDETVCPAEVKLLMGKARAIAASAAEREENAKRLRALLDNPHMAALQKAEQISQLFCKEYMQMNSVLELDDTELNRLKADIAGMALELTQIFERVLKAQPLITDAEQDAYFYAISQIMSQLGPDCDVNTIRFEIPSKASGKQIVHIFGGNSQLVKSINVDFGAVSLPYSLVKPLGNEFMFSYGGNRGIYAPFSGMDDAYKRLGVFSHTKLLSVTQTDSVEAVENLLTGLSRALKRGYVLQDRTPTFTEESRHDLRTRPLTSFDVPPHQVEHDVLQHLSRAQIAKAKNHFQVQTQLWVEDKRAEHDALSKIGVSLVTAPKPGIVAVEFVSEYKIVTDNIQGENLADTANKTLNLYSKGTEEYHNPAKRQAYMDLVALKDMTALSQAIVSVVEQYAGLHFSHNDLRPQSFVRKVNADGSYSISLINFATGGFLHQYPAQKVASKSVSDIFRELFLQSVDCEVDETGTQCFGKNGRFVERQADGTIIYGIRPTLEILHGARNGTLPFISPNVLGDMQCIAGADETLNTVLNPEDSSMDDWALTAMAFGICNRQAYFGLVKGRVVNDYVVPGVIDNDKGTPVGLKIIDLDAFNRFFNCGQPITEEEFGAPDFYSKVDKGVMFIPGNQREGEPMHLYRRLEQARAQLQKMDAPQALQVADSIEAILDDARRVVGNGEGYSKVQLQTQLNKIRSCIEQYEQLNDESYAHARQREEVLEGVLRAATIDIQKPDDLLLTKVGDVKVMDILCTYPKTKEQKEKATAILGKHITEPLVSRWILQDGAPLGNLLKACVANHHVEVMSLLLSKISSPLSGLKQYVTDSGLLHYCAEQGMSDTCAEIVLALKRAGVDDSSLFDMMLKQYGPHEGASHIHWSTNVCHIAIRHNDNVLLQTVLDLLPSWVKHADTVYEALHFCGVLGNKALFKQILAHCALHGGPVTVEQILQINYPKDNLSPYHLFMRDADTLDAINWDELTKSTANKALARQFILVKPGEAGELPALIAARQGNYTGVEKIIELGKQLQLPKEDWSAFFRQKDEEGKTVLNYILEQGNLEFFGKWLVLIQEQCERPNELVGYIVNNPKPVNPITNYLAFENNTSLQFLVLQQAMDGICSNYLTMNNPQLERSRVVALLLQKDWLIDRADNSQNENKLSDLFQNEALSRAYKKMLYERLLNAVPLSKPTAKRYFEARLAELIPKMTQADMDVCALEFPNIIKDLAHQTGELSELIDLLSSDKSELEGLRKDAARHKSILETQIREAAEKEQEISRLKSNLERLVGELAANKKSLEQLNQLMADANDRHQKAAQAYQFQIEAISLKLLGECDARADLIAKVREYTTGLLGERAAHVKEIERLKEVVNEVSARTDSLANAVKDTSAALNAAKFEADELKKAVVAKNKIIEKQGQELVEAQSISQDERRRLLAQLELTQNENLELAARAVSLARDVKKLTDENSIIRELNDMIAELKVAGDTLKRQLEQERLKTKALEEKVGRLETQVIAHQAECGLLQQSLAKEASQSKRLNDLLTSLTKDLAAAHAESERIRAEADANKEAFLRKIEQDGLKRQQLIDEYEEKTRRLAQELMDANTAKKSIHDKWLEIQQALTVSERRIVVFSTEVAQLKQEKARLVSVIDGASSDIQKKLSESELAQVQLSHDLESARQALRLANTTKDEQANELAAIDAKNKALEREVVSLREQVATLSAELAAVKKDINSEKQTVLDLKRQMASLDNELEAAKKESGLLKKQLDEARVATKKSQAVGTEPQGDLDTKIQALSAQLDIKGKELQERSNTVSSLTKDMDNLIAKNQLLSKALDSAKELHQEEVVSLKGELFISMKDGAQLIRDLELMRKELGLVKEDKSRLSLKMDDLVKANERLRVEVAAVDERPLKTGQDKCVKAMPKHIPPKKIEDSQQSSGANLLSEIGGQLGFSEWKGSINIHDIINKQTIEAITPNTTDNIHSSCHNAPGQVVFQKECVKKNEAVWAARMYDGQETDTKTGVVKKTRVAAVLRQDDTGRVENMSVHTNLAEEQKVHLAYQQAKMLLDNYRVAQGDIIVEGRDVAASNRLFAALLLLKRDNPHLYNTKVISLVPGCNGPEYPWYLPSRCSERRFIEQHLPQIHQRTQGHMLASEVKSTTAARLQFFAKGEGVLENHKDKRLTIKLGANG